MEAERQLELRLRAGWDGKPLGRCPKCGKHYYRIIPIGPPISRLTNQNDTILVHTLKVVKGIIIPDQTCHVKHDEILGK